MNTLKTATHSHHSGAAPLLAEMAGLHAALQVSDDAVAGAPIRLTYRLSVLDTGRPLTDIVESHERMLHTVVVSRDLAGFVHTHPVVGPDAGSFVGELNVSAAGTYLAFTEFERESGQRVLLRHEFDIGGPSKELAEPEPGDMVRRTAGYAVSLLHEESLHAGRSIAFVLEVRNEATGSGVRNLQPYLGAAAHVIIIRDASFQFSHHDGEPLGGTESDTGPRQDGFGPYIGFEHVFEEAGVYRIWAQFNGADGETRTAAWTVDAVDPEGEPHAREPLPPQFATLAASTAHHGHHQAMGDVPGDSSSGPDR
ncbi:hypothetical protein J0H33_04545 [bacterium]|nr:hypothetical protein [bacterium]